MKCGPPPFKMGTRGLMFSPDMIGTGGFEGDEMRTNSLVVKKTGWSQNLGFSHSFTSCVDTVEQVTYTLSPGFLLCKGVLIGLN